MPDNEYEQDLMTCVHCGFCLSSCPTYLETGSEADSPRGRIVLMRSLYEGEIDPSSPDMRRHIDLCLGCRACEVACPSAVPYGNLIEVARERMNKARPTSQRLARKALLASLTDPDKLRLSLRASSLTGGLPKPMAALLRGDPDDQAKPAASPEPSVAAKLPAVKSAKGKRRARVGMLAGCVMRVLYGDVNADTTEVLSANGCEVVVNQSQGCCGALHMHNGFAHEGRNLARKLIDAFWPFGGLDAIVINSAGCGSNMKEYGHLLKDDPLYAEKAAEFASKCKDVNEFLDNLGLVAPMNPLPLTVAYHDACHLAQAQRITQPPRKLLGQIPDLQLADMPESEVCCGSAGIYNLTEPGMARRLQARKVENILQTGAKVVATANPGCMAWIADGLATSGIEVVHPVTLLRKALS
jgi:glycolate oxidase iron-sulfur subunit